MQKNQTEYVQKDCTFTSDCDTEAVLAPYADYDENGPQCFDGCSLLLSHYLCIAHCL